VTSVSSLAGTPPYSQDHQVIVDFNKAVTLKPNFPVAHVQKLYTNYRAASMIGDHHGTVSSVLGKFQEAIDMFPKCLETYTLHAQVLNNQQVI
jgi:import receptor subunit TOM70